MAEQAAAMAAPAPQSPIDIPQLVAMTAQQRQAVMNMMQAFQQHVLSGNGAPGGAQSVSGNPNRDLASASRDEKYFHKLEKFSNKR